MKYLLALSLSIFCFSKGFTQISNLFSTPKPLSGPLLKSVKQGKTAILNIEKSLKIYASHPSNIAINFPFPSGEKLIEFEQNDIHASDFKVLDSRNISVESGLKYPIHYKGKNNKRGIETASLSIFSSGEIVMVYSQKNGNINLIKLEDELSSPNEYIIYNDVDLLTKNPFECKADEITKPNKPEFNPINPDQIQNDSACRLTEIYWECDHNMFTQSGNSIQTTLNKFESMFNGTAVLFEVENINIGVKAVKVWNTPDPYNYQSSFTALDDFQEAGNTANWPGQLAHLLSTRDLSLGGVAYLNALCGSFRYGFSNIDYFFNPLPNYSWTLSTIAHELGHNFSSPHTHNCNWEVSPGVFGQIDSCWTAEGDCQPTRRGRTGTIMSYCHLTGNVNLSLGFGPLPGNRIRNAYANMPCVSGTIVVPNFTPALANNEFCIGDTIQLLSENLTGFSYFWSGPGGFSSNLQSPTIPNASTSAEGIYKLKVKKATCESREKEVGLTFNCMKVGELPNNICAGSNLYIPFSSTGSFNSGNQFITQLSNRFGLFTNPINLDTINANSPQLISTKLPFQITEGENYKIRLLSTNPVYVGKPGTKSFRVNNIGFAPSPKNGERCGTGTVQISVEGGSNIVWFKAPSDFEPLFFGRNFVTPFLNNSVSYYAQSGSTTKGRAGLKKEQANGFSSEPNGLKFDVLTTLRFDSISLIHNTFTGKICRIRILKNGFELFKKSIIANGSNTKVPMFWRIDPGSDYEIIADSINIPLAISEGSGTTFPINTIGLIKINKNANSLNAIYPYFFNWILSEYLSCPSAKVEVKAIVKAGTVPEVPTIESTGFDSLLTNQQGTIYQWSVNGQVNPLVTGNKIKGLQNSSYRVRFKIDSCWSDWSISKVFIATSTGQILEEFEPNFYPNPTKGSLEIEPGQNPIQIILYNSIGSKILERSISTKTKVELNSYSSGIYICKWKGLESSGTIKISKE